MAGLFTQLAVTVNRLGKDPHIVNRRHAGVTADKDYLLLAGLFAVALLAILLAVMITRSVTRPVKEAVEVASRVAAGDLTAQLNVSGSNEMAELLNALMRMQQRLAQLVSDIKGNAATIANSSEDLPVTDTVPDDAHQFEIAVIPAVDRCSGYPACRSG